MMQRADLRKLPVLGQRTLSDRTLLAFWAVGVHTALDQDTPLIPRDFDLSPLAGGQDEAQRSCLLAFLRGWGWGYAIKDGVADLLETLFAEPEVV